MVLLGQKGAKRMPASIRSMQAPSAWFWLRPRDNSDPLGYDVYARPREQLYLVHVQLTYLFTSRLLQHRHDILRESQFVAQPR